MWVDIHVQIIGAGIIKMSMCREWVDKHVHMVLVRDALGKWVNCVQLACLFGMYIGMYKGNI